jgi:hypothetical protein
MWMVVTCSLAGGGGGQSVWWIDAPVHDTKQMDTAKM